MKYFVIIFFITIQLGFSAVALAVTPTVNSNGTTPTINSNGQTPTVQPEPFSIGNPIAANSITDLFKTLIDIVMVFAVPIIVFFIIYAGFLYVSARGNEHTIEKAHMALLYAIIGGVLILGANVLITVVQGTVDGVTGTDHQSI